MFSSQMNTVTFLRISRPGKLRIDLPGYMSWPKTCRQWTFKSTNSTTLERVMRHIMHNVEPKSPVAGVTERLTHYSEKYLLEQQKASFLFGPPLITSFLALLLFLPFLLRASSPILLKPRRSPRQPLTTSPSSTSSASKPPSSNNSPVFLHASFPPPRQHRA